MEATTDRALATVLFLCVHNAGRSQMALGWFTHLVGDRAVAWSGGSEPGDEVNPAAVAAMAEVGIDISGERPKPWTDDIVQLDDPAGRDVEAVRPIRDEIERRVRDLLASLGVPTEGQSFS